MTRILVTGFEAFGEYCSNPSGDVALALDGFEDVDLHLTGMVLPVVRDAAAVELIAQVENIRPDLVVMLGVASDRSLISVERVALNIDDFSIPDNAGNQPRESRIEDFAPDAYFSDMPVAAMASAVKEAGAAAEVSYCAGTFVCNNLFFNVMHHIRSNDLPMRACFIHVPPCESGDGSAEFDSQIERLTDAVVSACRMAARYPGL